jgi:putative transposase
VYREASLSVKRTLRKKLVRAGVNQPVSTAPNDEWSLDFLCDALATGRVVRVLSIVDKFTRECLALEADTSFASERVTRLLDSVIARRGAPKALRLDIGDGISARACSVQRQAIQAERRAVRRIAPLAQRDRPPNRVNICSEVSTMRQL